MTVNKNSAADAAEQILAEEAKKVPSQKGETKVSVEEKDGKTLITVTEDGKSETALNKVKSLLKNRKVLATASAVLTIAAIAVIRNKNSQTVVEDDADETPAS